MHSLTLQQKIENLEEQIKFKSEKIRRLTEEIQLLEARKRKLSQVQSNQNPVNSTTSQRMNLL